ncbi:MAM and LDL-receptor class A domain-containing protein 1-like [Ciona intestinalis]
MISIAFKHETHSMFKQFINSYPVSQNRNSAGGSDKWPKTRSGPNRGLVRIPYKISSQYNRTQLAVIRSAMATFTRHTCLRFVPRRSEVAYIFISNGKGCWAYVGKTGYSSQTVSLGIPGCVAKGIVLHEFMHVAGFQHEHSRSDRNRYVQILRQNIQGDMTMNFELYNDTVNYVVYDYNSVMHYSKTAFSKQIYLPSIQVIPKRKPEPIIGQRERLSPYDIEEVKYLYDCGAGTYQRCGRDFFNLATGSFNSPRYPSPYPEEAHCTWNITVRPGRFVNVTFKGIDISDSPLCQNDGLLIHDGKNAAAPTMRTICGTQSGDISIVSTGRSMFIMFSSDPTRDSNRGFRAVFRETRLPGRTARALAMPTLPPITHSLGRFQCNFDQGTCGMTQDTLDQLDWIRSRGPTPSRNTGPFFDNTNGQGYFMFVESSLPAEAGDNAIMRTPWLNGVNFCVTFSYHMYGAYMGSLRLYALEKRTTDGYGHEVLLWEKHGNHGRNWLTQEINYNAGNNVESVHFYWEVFVFYYQSDIGLDDIDISPGTCRSTPVATTTSPRLVVWTTNRRPTTPTTTPPTTTTATTTTTTRSTAATTTTRRTIPTTVPPVAYASINCTFDNDLCGWTQSRSDTFDWTQRQGPTPSHSTGPTSDHTTQNGMYMFIEASSPRKLGHKAQLISPLITPQTHCLHMFYHMYGRQIGTLTVAQMVGGTRTNLIELTGEKGNLWNSLSVEINSGSVRKSSRRSDREERQFIRSEENARGNPAQDPDLDVASTNTQHDSMVVGTRQTGLLQAHPDLRVIIEGTTGRGYAGDIAIDDVVITDAPCDTTPSVATVVLANDFNCNFDADICDMIQNGDNLDNFDWTRNSGPTGSAATGPSTDHTMGNEQGYYMYIESSSPRMGNQIAELSTPKMTPQQYCVRFFSHMWGSATGAMRVFSIEELPGTSSDSRLRQLNVVGNQGDSWIAREFDFVHNTNALNVKFVFQGKVGPSFTSDIAMDDLTITPGTCQASSSTAAPTTTTTRRTTTTTRPTTTTTTTRPTTTTTTTQPPTTTTTTTTATTTTPTTTTTTTSQPTTTTRLTRRSTTTTTTTVPPTTTTTTAPTTTTTTTPPPTTTTTTTVPTTTTTTTTTPATTTTLAPVNIIPTDFACDFDASSDCGITQSTTDDFNWIRHRGKTSSGGTGPLADHTSGTTSGYYMYVEGSRPRRRNHEAIISTPSLGVSKAKRCVTFWYHMWGSGMGTLDVTAEFATPNRPNVRTNGGALPTNTNSVFRRQGNQDRNWLSARVTLDQHQSYMGGSVVLHFRAIRGDTFQTDLAIDDICTSEGPCDSNNRCNAAGRLIATTTPAVVATTTTTTPATTTTGSTTTVSTTSLATTTLDPLLRLCVGMPLCTFESRQPNNQRPRTASVAPPPGRGASRDLGPHDPHAPYANDLMCGWKQLVQRDQFNWTRHSGATVSRGTGPPGDHTTTRGYYMYIETSTPRKMNDKAFLQTYLMFATDYCLDIYYNMYGVFAGRLSVRSVQRLTNGRTTLSYLKNVAGNQGTRWKNMKVQYRPPRNAREVAFRLEGVVGKDYRGDIAIDDIAIHPGRCNACARPSHSFTNNLNQQQSFSTGCAHARLFYVRCCSLTQEKVVYRRVDNCDRNMFSPPRLNWFCNNM